MARKLSDKEVKDLAADIVSSTPNLKKLPTSELAEWLTKYKIDFSEEDIKALQDELIGFYGVNVNESKGPIKLITEALSAMIVDESDASLYGTPVSKPSELVKGETYTWCGGAELQDIIYIGISIKHPDKKPSTSMGKGFLFQWAGDKKYMELSMNAIRNNVIFKEKELVEGVGRNIKKFPFVMHWSDGVAQALGGDTYMELINAANAKGLKSFAIFKQAAGFHSTTQENYLVAWYDKDGNGYWSNRAKKEPDLNDRKLNDDFQTPSEVDESQSVNEGTWAENRDGNMEMYLGNKEGTLYILPKEDGTFDVVHDTNESGKEDYVVDTGFQTVEDAQEAAASYAENHLGININEANDLNTDLMNLDVRMKHDWTTDLGDKLKTGEIVNIDITEKSPGSTWDLISVRRKGKHIGYVESENWPSMFDVIGKSKYSPEYEPESTDESKVNEAEDTEYFDIEAKLRDICFQQSQQQISNDEAAQQIQDVLKDSEELSAVFTDVEPSALVDRVIDHYGWTASDLAEALNPGEGSAISADADARFKEICAKYYADLLPTADAVEQAKAALDDCEDTSLQEACSEFDDEEIISVIAQHYGWNVFDLAESVQK